METRQAWNLPSYISTLSKYTNKWVIRIQHERQVQGAVAVRERGT